MIARRYRVAGRVQGVGFRAFTHRAGENLGLRGWVRNVSDGTVEAHAEGEEGLLERFEEALRSGPPASRVEKVDVESAAVAGEPAFVVRPTRY